MEEQRQNLKEFYKRIVKCSGCQKIYGTDIPKESETGICPICTLNARGRGSIYLRNNKLLS